MIINTGNRVSVVIAAYNRPSFLREALQSIINQTVPVFEIIVIDDCSKVDLQPVISEFSEHNIIYFKKEVNLGVSNSRNQGILRASGDWVSFLDDDDVYLPHKIEYNLIDSRIENCSAILCGYQILESGEHSNFLQSQIIKKEVFKLGNPFCGTSGLFAKREFLLKEMFDESLPLGEDWDVFIRLTKYGVMYFNSVPHFLYRKGHESITTSAKKQSVNDVERYILSSRKHREWLGESNYKVRVARVYLSYIRFKNNKLSWVYHSIKAAGFKANFIVFFNIFMKIR